ncbi:MAG: tRNA 2-thiouridine(34) synthase MnmA [Gammaproteobacteria bacterium]|nr:tRNA 2-thiouridine(34) synthase MnmA [Gammaproteobacteria bacterium]
MAAERVIVGLSGGVDSSVTALLLKEQGYDVHGLFMDNWDDDDAYCTAAEDFQDARQVAAAIGIPIHKVNFAEEYKERVFAYFLEEYEAGRTPNPDVLCNSEIKFKAFLDYALRLGADWIATGHYARVEHGENESRLLKAADQGKDQTYFLHAVPQAAMRKTLFPLGELQKDEVRDLAARHGFVNHDKKDSTGICFIGERDFREFLKKYLPVKPGPMRTPEGEVVGEHEGLSYYTLGQRKGLMIGGLKDASDDPWYVVDKQESDNALVVAQGHDHPLLHHDALAFEKPHWVRTVPGVGRELMAKTRYRQADQACQLTRLDEHGGELVFTAAQRAITPGQYVVLYEGEECLGGGVITRRFNTRSEAA